MSPAMPAPDGENRKASPSPPKPGTNSADGPVVPPDLPRPPVMSLKLKLVLPA